MNNTFTHNLSDSEVIRAFSQWLENQGLNLESREPIMNGKRQYTTVKNRAKKKRKSGWYIGYLDRDIPTGSCGWYNISSKDIAPPCFYFNLYNDYIKTNGISKALTKLSENELEKNRLKEESKFISDALEDEYQQQLSCLYTHFEYNRSFPLHTHNYIDVKNIPAATARLLNPNNFNEIELSEFLNRYYPGYIYHQRLVCDLLKLQENSPTDSPLFYSRKDIIFLLAQRFNQPYASFQYILPTKTRKGLQKFFAGIPYSKQGSFHVIGPPIPENSLFIRYRFILCEGWATGVAISILVKHTITVLVCWDAGNIRSVAEELRMRFYGCDIWIFSDNDHDKIENGTNIPVNTGLTVSYMCASIVGAYVAPPPFDSTCTEHKGLSDWHDLYNLLGYAATQDILRILMKNAKFNPAKYSIENEQFHQPLLISDRVNELNVVDEVLESSEFAYALLSFNEIIKRGVNEEYSDEKISLLYSHEYERLNPKIYKRYNLCIKSPIRSLISNVVESLCSQLILEAIKETSILSLKPLIHELFSICVLISSNHLEMYKLRIQSLLTTYNSAEWSNTVIMSVADHIYIDHNLYVPKIIRKMKDDFLHYNFPLHVGQELEPDSSIPSNVFSIYLVWMLNWPLNTGILRDVENMPIHHMNHYFALYIQTINKFYSHQYFIKNAPVSHSYTALNAKLNRAYGEFLVEVMGSDNDIKSYKTNVLDMFMIVSEHPHLYFLVSNMILSVFEMKESVEWSNAVLNSMTANTGFQANI